MVLINEGFNGSDKTVYLVWKNLKMQNLNANEEQLHRNGFGDKIRGALALHQFCVANKIPIIVDATEDICGRFLKNVKYNDFEKNDIENIINKAYGGNFDDSEITPLKHLTNNQYILELWHGPTLAFKDIALQIMPYFFSKAAAAGRANWSMICVVYQVTLPSFFAASIRAASWARTVPPDSMAKAARRQAASPAGTLLPCMPSACSITGLTGRYLYR
jgi:hypothetical protein